MREVRAVSIALFLLALTACTVIAAPLESDTLHVATYVPNGSGWDAIGTGKILDLGDGCVGLLRTVDQERFIAAFPVGSTLEGDTLATPDGTELGLGDHIEFLGFSDADSSEPSLSVAIPEQCGDGAIWYLDAIQVQ